MESLEFYNPVLFQELTLKKSNTYKNPIGWGNLNNLPTRSVENVIRPDILQKDIEGCKAMLVRR